MNAAVVSRVVPAALALAGVIALGLWGASGEKTGMEVRLPGQDGRPTTQATGPLVDLKGNLKPSDGKAGASEGDWPWFRGELRDGMSAQAVRLAHSWRGDGPKKLWQIELTEGYAGAAVRAGRVYVLDYDEASRADALRCLSLEDGREIWRRSYQVDVTRNHGISRTIPAVSEKGVVTIGPKCHVVCVDPISGQFKWGIDLVRELGATAPQWYAGQCPLIDGDRVILGVGGPGALLAGVDLESRRILWKTPNPRHWEMTHSSIAAGMLAGKKMYLYCASGGVVGVDGEDGRLLWEYSGWKVTMANVPTPVIVDQGRVFLSGGYGAGSMMLGISAAAGKFDVAPVFRLRPEAFGAEQHTPILYQEHLYGIAAGGQMVCLDLQGNRLWASGIKTRFGLGPFIIADGLIIGLTENGVLMLAEATPQSWRPLVQAKLWGDGHEAWGPLALAGGRLLARDLTRMVCVDLREAKP